MRPCMHTDSPWSFHWTVWRHRYQESYRQWPSVPPEGNAWGPSVRPDSATVPYKTNRGVSTKIMNKTPYAVVCSIYVLHLLRCPNIPELRHLASLGLLGGHFLQDAVILGNRFRQALAQNTSTCIPTIEYFKITLTTVIWIDWQWSSSEGKIAIAHAASDIIYANPR